MALITVLPCVDLPSLPGTLTEVTTTVADGTTVRSWLVLPEDRAPAPLLLWVHGGPLGSWNDWAWRWNPWLMAAKGYAVLLPDPALSTGYGQDFIQRGWGAWGGPPFDDLMTATDAACAHPRIDATRIAAMGGSFGGYMANWIAGHTNRFAAIVTHASLWALDQFSPTTDHAYYWRREMTPEMTAANSPHHFVDRISTPMLVIHGDKDYRVPIGEACGSGTSCSPTRRCRPAKTAAVRTDSCISRPRTTGSLRHNTPRSGTRWCSLSWPNTCWGRAPNCRRYSE